MNRYLLSAILLLASMNSGFSQRLPVTGSMEVSRTSRPEEPLGASQLFLSGNEAFRLGRYPEAILAYRRSLVRSGPDERTRFNLQEAERRLGLRPQREGPIASFLRQLQSPLDESGLIWILLVLETILLVMLILMKKRSGRAFVLLLLCCMGWCFAQAFRQVEHEEQKRAVILKSGAGLRAEPQLSFPLLTALLPGSLVTVEAESSRWILVRQEGRLGYLPHDQIGLVD